MMAKYTAILVPDGTNKESATDVRTVMVESPKRLGKVTESDVANEVFSQGIIDKHSFRKYWKIDSIEFEPVLTVESALEGREPQESKLKTYTIEFLDADGNPKSGDIRLPKGQYKEQSEWEAKMKSDSRVTEQQTRAEFLDAVLHLAIEDMDHTAYRIANHLENSTRLPPQLALASHLRDVDKYDISRRVAIDR